MDKKQLRKNIIAYRSGLDKSVIADASERIFSKLSGLTDFFSHSSYFVYKSFRGEVDTDILVCELLRRGKTVAFPVTAGDSMIAAVPHKNSNYSLDKFGVLIPEKYEVLHNPEVVITPLVACDLSKNRIGFGMGYYDRYFSTHDCIKIGVCYDFQVVDSITPSPLDVKLDIIVTEKRII